MRIHKAMGRACSTNRGEERLLVGNLRERDHLGDPGVHGRMILRWIFWKWDMGYGLDRTGLDRDKRGALVNAVMNLRVP
jgi:hypothetical protein